MEARVVCSLLVSIAVIAPTAAAQQGTPACQAPEYRQFDFWTGQWEVFNPQGQQVGKNTITPIENGCVLHERWESASGGTGQSFNIYDNGSGQWHQTWVASSGTLLQLDGGLHDGSMVMRGETKAPQSDGVINQEIAWTRISADTVTQVWRQSRDGGETWTTAFHGTYVRKKN